MPLDWVEPEVAVIHNGKAVFHTYKNDMMQEGTSECFFTCDSTRTDRDDGFDFRELKAYKATPSKDYREVLKLALETGEIEGEDWVEESLPTPSPQPTPLPQPSSPAVELRAVERAKQAIEAVLEVVEMTYGHDEETGERDNSDARFSGADVVDALCATEDLLQTVQAELSSSNREGQRDWAIVEFDLVDPPSTIYDAVVMQTALTERQAWSMAEDWANTLLRDLNRRSYEQLKIEAKVVKTDHGFFVQDTKEKHPRDYYYVGVSPVDLCDLDVWKS